MMTAIAAMCGGAAGPNSGKVVSRSGPSGSSHGTTARKLTGKAPNGMASRQRGLRTWFGSAQASR